MINDAYRLRLQRAGQPVPDEVLQIADYLESSVNSGRRLIEQLWAVDFEKTTFAEAIANVIRRFSSEAEVQIHLEADPAAEGTDAFERLMMYRIAHEAIANVARHSSASNATVTLRMADRGQRTLEITDNGSGFDPQNVDDGHFGLRSIQERAGMVGGIATIHSCPEGTTVRVDLPSSSQTPPPSDG